MLRFAISSPSSMIVNPCCGLDLGRGTRYIAITDLILSIFKLAWALLYLIMGVSVGFVLDVEILANSKSRPFPINTTIAQLLKEQTCLSLVKEKTQDIRLSFAILALYVIFLIGFVNIFASLILLRGSSTRKVGHCKTWIFTRISTMTLLLISFTVNQLSTEGHLFLSEIFNICFFLFHFYGLFVVWAFIIDIRSLINRSSYRSFVKDFEFYQHFY